MPVNWGRAVTNYKVIFEYLKKKIRTTFFNAGLASQGHFLLSQKSAVHPPPPPIRVLELGVQCPALPMTWLLYIYIQRMVKIKS